MLGALLWLSLVGVATTLSSIFPHVNRAGAVGLMMALIFHILVASHPKERHLKSPNDDKDATKSVTNGLF